MTNLQLSSTSTFTPLSGAVPPGHPASLSRNYLFAAPVSGAAAAATPASVPIIPGVLWLTWNVDAANHSATLQVILLGLQIDKLSGTYDWSQGTASLADDLDLSVLTFHIIQGHLEVDVDKTGIKIQGDLKFLGNDIANMNTYIVQW